jgi:glycosyltransferase involved in cell wall biosynthesis
MSDLVNSRIHSMQSAGLVSIIIVALNNWPDLELAIQSALHQSYQPIEVIVVDNFSTDDTPREVQRLFGARIRYVRQPNVGEGGARNTGVRLAAGEFIQFLDGDDFLAPNKVEKQIAFLNANPGVDIVYGDVRQFQSAPGPAHWEDWDTGNHQDMLATLLSPDGNGGGLMPHSLIFRRHAVNRIGPWAESAPDAAGAVHAYEGHDQEYWLRAAWVGCRFRYCPGSMCFYRRRPGQLSSDARAMTRGMESVWLRAREYIIREPYRTAVAKRLAQLLFYLAISEPGSTVRLDLSRLRRAREASPDTVTFPAFAIAWLLIATRTGPLLFNRWLRPLRRMVAKLIGYPSRIRITDNAAR